MLPRPVEPPNPSVLEWAPIRWTNDECVLGATESKVRFLDKEPPLSTQPDKKDHEKMLDSASLQVSNAKLKRWFAWALEQNQEATEKSIERLHAELKAHLDEKIMRLAASAERLENQPNAVAHSQGVAGGDSSPLWLNILRRGSPKARRRFTTGSDSFPTLDSGTLPAGNTIQPVVQEPEAPAMEVVTAQDSVEECVLVEDSVDEKLSRQGVIERGPTRSFSFMQPVAEPWAQKLIARVNTLALAMVVMNTILLYLQLDHLGMQAADRLGLGSSASWDQLNTHFFAADHIFNAFFCLELMMKVIILRCPYFQDPMNVFDSVVVIANCFNLVVLDGSSDVMLARLARIVKVLRVCRVSRVARASHDLRVLLNTLVLSMRALIWSAVLLALIIVLSGMAMSQFVGLYLVESCTPDDDLCLWAYQHYGGASRAAWTMFRVTLSGGWPKYADNLVDEVSSLYVIFWILYIVVVWFAVIRILTALFLRQTMEVASSDQEMMVLEKMKTKSTFADKLRNFFNKTADLDGDGYITREEFRIALSDPVACTSLQTLEIDTTEIENLFTMLDDGDGKISFEEFLGGAARLKGAARSIDQITIIHNQTKMLTRIELLCDRLGLATSSSVSRPWGLV